MSTNPGKSTALGILAAEGAGLLLIRAFNIGSGLLIVAILTRGLGPQEFGTYTFALALCSVIGLAMHWGIYTLLAGQVSASLARLEFTKAQSLEIFSRKVILVSVPVAAIVFIIVSNVLVSAGLFELPPVVIGCIICLAAAGAFQLRSSAILSGRGHQLNAQLSESFVKPLLFIGLLACFGSFWSGDYTKTLYLCAAASIVAVPLGEYLVHKSRPKEQSTTICPDSYNDWYRQMPPFVLIAMIGIAMANADVLVLFKVLPRSELGEYKLAAFIAAIPGTLHSIVISMLMPRAAAAWARQEETYLRTIACLASRISFTFALFYSVIFYICGDFFIDYIFGSSFKKTYYLTCLLLVPSLCATFAGSSFTLLNMCGEARLNSGIALAGLTLNLSSLGLFGAIWGSEGAAVAAGLSALALNAAGWIAVKWRIGIRSDILG